LELYERKYDNEVSGKTRQKQRLFLPIIFRFQAKTTVCTILIGQKMICLLRRKDLCRIASEMRRFCSLTIEIREDLCAFKRTELRQTTLRTIIEPRMEPLQLLQPNGQPFLKLNTHVRVELLVNQ